MSKQKNIEEVFRAAHISAANTPEPLLSHGWQSRLMDEVRRTARLSKPALDDESPLNLFAFRLGWAMLGLAIIVSAALYTAGIKTSTATDTASDSSLWELVDQSANAYAANFYDKTDGSIGK